MGVIMSVMSGGLTSPSQIFSALVGVLYKQFVNEDINNFDKFHEAILDIFNTINMALPGKHYDAPPSKDIKNLFQKWQEESSNEEKRKELFTEFMNKNVKVRKVDSSMMLTGLVAPPAAMVVKRAGETMPQLKPVKYIPDVVFVPSATVVALVAVKISGIIFKRKTSSSSSSSQPNTSHAATTTSRTMTRH